MALIDLTVEFRYGVQAVGVPWPPLNSGRLFFVVLPTAVSEVKMDRYVYSFRSEPEEGEVFFRFPRFPEIISSVTSAEFNRMSEDDVYEWAHDAAVTALQGAVSLREKIPTPENPGLVAADGFVSLSVREAMKLELYKVYVENCTSIAEFARHLNKPQTVARRLLDLRQPSKESEIEAAIGVFGKQLVHNWSLEPNSRKRHIHDSGVHAAGAHD